MTSVGDDVWRRIFDRCGSTTQSWSGSSDQATAADAENFYAARYVFYLSNAASGPRFIAHGPASSASKSCHWRQWQHGRTPPLRPSQSSPAGTGPATALVVLSISAGSIRPAPTLALKLELRKRRGRSPSWQSSTLATAWSHRWSGTQ